MDMTLNNKILTVNIPVGNLSPKAVNEMISLLKVVLAPGKRKMPLKEAEVIAEEISEEMKKSWWNYNKDCITQMINEHESKSRS